MAGFDESDVFWWERAQFIDRKKGEFYPRGKSADAVSYFFPPGVEATITVGYQNPDTQGLHLGYGSVTTDPVEGEVTEGMIAADTTSDTTQMDGELFKWGLAGVAHGWDLMRYGVRVVDRSVGRDDDNINGKYVADWRVGRIDFGTTWDPVTGYAAANSAAIWNILAFAYSARAYAIGARLPLEQVKFSHLSGSGYVPAIDCWLARVELNVLPDSLDAKPGSPAIWRGGRIAFGHF